MIRRFVNVVAENYKTGIYSLHRLDVYKHLFHQSRADASPVMGAEEAQDNTAAAAAAGAEIDMLQELPAPCLKIQPCGNGNDERILVKLPFWGLLSPRRSEDNILCINWMGNAARCYADEQSVGPMPPLREEVGIDPISFSVVRPGAQEQQQQEEEEDLYIIHIGPEAGVNPFCFRVLRSEGARWRWESLPPPPCVGGPRYDPARFIHSYTMIDGGRTFCMSCAPEDIGTYCFDAAERQWRHAGHWTLPFQGRAEYVPDLNLWLGFFRRSPYHDLCLCGTSDLHNDMAMAPKLQYVWRDLVTPQNWLSARAELISLGAGRFCIAKAFHVKNSCNHDWDWHALEDEVVVLTGVEVGRVRGDETGLTLWRHKSVQFGSADNTTWVL